MKDCWKLVKDFPSVKEDGIRGFATASGVTNPIHHDKEHAMTKGLCDIIAPGLMTMVFLDSAVSEKIPDCRIVSIENLKFKNSLYPGVAPVVSCIQEHVHGNFLKVKFEIRGGDKILARGSCTLLLP